MKTPILEVPVLVVGAGPAGLTAALLLQQYGIEAVTINRYGWTAHTPRAHYQNQRSIEILRELALEAAVVAAGLPESLAQNVVWTETLAGVEYARIPTYLATRVDEYRRASPCPSSNVAQHLLEPLMAQALLERGGQVRWQHEFVDLVQDDAGVNVTVLDRLENRHYTVRAQYVIGADGARSRVAEVLGIGHTGRAAWGAAVNVWFKADLRRYCEHRPGFLYWTNRPGANFWVGSGGFINVRPWDEWVLSFMYDPAHGEPDLSEAAMVARVRELVGDPALDVQVLSVSPWRMNALVAERMQQGRVFLAGDAVHRHPPSGGLGSNTSMQDSYNLCWKLAQVLRGQAGAPLLDSYGVERLPVAQQIVDRSMVNIEIFLEVAQAIGFAHGQTEAEGWAAHAELAAPTPEGAAKRAALQRALQRQHYHFSGLGLEMGVRYAQGAVVQEDSAALPSPAPVPDEALIHFQPTTAPGAHLPHAWLSQGGARCSTLDVCAPGRYTLLVGHVHQAWAGAAQAVAETLALPLDVVSIGIGLQWRDVHGDWPALREVQDDGCLLVRPDKVVAWRSAGAVPDPVRTLEGVLRQVSARPAGPHKEVQA